MALARLPGVRRRPPALSDLSPAGPTSRATAAIATQAAQAQASCIAAEDAGQAAPSAAKASFGAGWVRALPRLWSPGREEAAFRAWCIRQV